MASGDSATRMQSVSIPPAVVKNAMPTEPVIDSVHGE